MTSSESIVKKDELKSISLVWVGIFIIIVGGIGIYGYFSYDSVNNALDSVTTRSHIIQVMNHTSNPDIETYRYIFVVNNPSDEKISLSGWLGCYHEPTTFVVRFDFDNELAKPNSETTIVVYQKVTHNAGGSIFEYLGVNEFTYEGRIEAQGTILGFIPISKTYNVAGKNYPAR